jgi:hypothetical protein
MKPKQPAGPQIERLLGGAPRLAFEDIKHPRLPEAREVYLDHFLNVIR